MNTIVTTHRVIANNIFKIFYIARKRNMDVKITTYSMEYAVVSYANEYIFHHDLNSFIKNRA